MMTARVTECRDCKAKIMFIKIAGKDRTMPVNAESVYYIQKAGGKEKIVTPNGEVLSAELTDNPDVATGIGYISHFATCPNADKFRNKNKSDRKKAR